MCKLTKFIGNKYKYRAKLTGRIFDLLPLSVNSCLNIVLYDSRSNSLES